MDLKFLHLACSLASENIGNTGPNPSVGAVIVYDNSVIATGKTAFGGRPHAETVAINNAIKNGFDKFSEAIIYVSLEPCSHTGQTPPCTEAIINSGIKNVVVGCIDPDERVKGNGIKALENAGITVSLQNIPEAAYVHRGFISRITKNRPYITLKCAITLDGMIATKNGDSKWITCESSRNYTHMLRSRNDAILIGKGTYLADNPQLDVRLLGLEDRSPQKLILSSSMQNNIPGFTVINNINEIYNLPNINYLFVEGGAKTIENFIKNNLFDELVLIQANKIIGNGIAFSGNLNIDLMSEALSLKLHESFYIENDLIRIFKA